MPAFLRQNFHFATLAVFAPTPPEPIPSETLTATAKPTPVPDGGFPASLSPQFRDSDPESSDDGGVRGPTDDSGVELMLMLLLIASATGVEPEPGFELELELLDLDADGIVAGGALAGGGSILECVYVCG